MCHKLFVMKCSMSIRYIGFKLLPFKSHPVGSNGRNNIIAVTPMKFLPVKEFEKRQKSINPNQNRAIMSSAMKKIGFQMKTCEFYPELLSLRTSGRRRSRRPRTLKPSFSPIYSLRKCWFSSWPPYLISRCLE